MDGTCCDHVVEIHTKEKKKKAGKKALNFKERSG